MVTGSRIRYRDAGVNIDEADRAVGAIKKMAQRTFSRNVLTQIGTFGACYALAGWKKPVLVSSVDGVGTKLKIAFLTGRHATTGKDLSNNAATTTPVKAPNPLSSLTTSPSANLTPKLPQASYPGITQACVETAA